MRHQTETRGYWRDNGCIWLLAAGVLLWLLAAIWPVPHREAVSWSAFGVAVLAYLLGVREPLRGWRLPVAGSLAATLLGLALWLALGTAAPSSSFESYREARGDRACSTTACEGHEAGWDWAQRNSIADPDECRGMSLSFEDGCRAWAEEQAGR
jgi:hypothetical protein